MSAERLTKALQAAGIAITGLSVGTDGVAATVTVEPANLQASAQSIINAFDWSGPAQAAYDLQRQQATIGVQTIRRKSANQSSTVTALADVADLSFVLAPNTHYKFTFMGAYSAAVSTTGLTLAVNGPASPSFLAFIALIGVGQLAPPAMGAGGAYEVPMTGPTSAGATSLPFWLEGTISTGAVGGTFTLRFASEVGGSTVTILRGSLAELAAAA